MKSSKSQPDIKENLDHIWTSHCLNKKPVLAKRGRRRPVVDSKKISTPTIDENILTDTN